MEELSDEEHIRRLRRTAMRSGDMEVQCRLIDALAGFGSRGMPAILEVVARSRHPEVRDYAERVVRGLMEEAAGGGQWLGSSPRP